MARVEHLPPDIRQGINRYLSVPYLGHRVLERTRDRIHSPNRWCVICGETNGYRCGYAPTQFRRTRRRACPRVVLLCGSCDRTICHTCSNEQRCCSLRATS